MVRSLHGIQRRGKEGGKDRGEEGEEADILEGSRVVG